MGSGISSNYENMTPMFTLGYWKVHNATQKETHDPVSLWLLDIDKIKSDSSAKKERNTYIESCLYSIKTLQQLNHPNVLKIYEANENLSDLAFSAEPVSFSMERNLEYSNDEAYYIADQLASLASYLANDKKFVSFHYYPGSFAFNSKFILKLCLFNYTSLIVGSQNKTVPRYPWRNIPYAPPLNYTAPEYSNNLQTTSAADTFSYGALITSIFIGKQFFNFQNEKEIQKAIATGSFDIPESIPSDILGLLQCCFESDPSRRLTFNEIVRFPVFMNLLIRCLRELDSITKRGQSERYEFYMKLKQNITLFSSRLLQNKILPILIDDLNFDVRFGPAVLPIIYFIADKMNKDDFMNLIFNPLSNLMRRMDPPEFGVAILDGVNIIINHVERNLIYEIVYPILIAGFLSPNSSVQVAAAKNMPYLASMVSENCITYNIIPKVGEVILHASDPRVIGFLLKTYEISLDKMDNDMFIEGVIPTLFKLWKKIRSPQLAKPYLTIIQKENASLIKNISFVVPLICEILKNEEVELQLQGEFCYFVEAQFEELKKDRRIPISQQKQNNDPRLNPHLAKQLQGTANNKLPSFAKPIQDQNAKSMPDFPVNGGSQENNSFNESTMQHQSESPVKNEFMQLDQDDIFNSFNATIGTDYNSGSRKNSMNSNSSGNLPNISSNSDRANPVSNQNGVSNSVNQGTDSFNNANQNEVTNNNIQSNFTSSQNEITNNINQNSQINFSNSQTNIVNNQINSSQNNQNGFGLDNSSQNIYNSNSQNNFNSNGFNIGLNNINDTENANNANSFNIFSDNNITNSNINASNSGFNENNFSNFNSSPNSSNYNFYNDIAGITDNSNNNNNNATSSMSNFQQNSLNQQPATGGNENANSDAIQQSVNEFSFF